MSNKRALDEIVICPGDAGDHVSKTRCTHRHITSESGRVYLSADHVVIHLTHRIDTRYFIVPAKVYTLPEVVLRHLPKQKLVAIISNSVHSISLLFTF